MRTSRAVATNTLLLSVGLLATRTLALLVTKKMTPVLGTDGLGIWGWATDVSGIVMVIANYGLGTLITREVARAREMTLPIMWAALRIRWLMAALCSLCLFAYVLLTGKESLARAAMMITAAAVFIESTAMACDSVLQAHDKVQFQTVGQVVSAIVYFGLACWALDAGFGLMGIVWANLISRFVRLGVMVPLMLANTGPWHFGTTEPGKELGFGWMARLGWPVFLSTTFGIIHFKIDIAMLTEMVGKDPTGIYFLGHRALDYLFLVPNLFATALFPAMARLGPEGLEDTARMGERALRYLMVVALPLTLFTMLVAGPVIQWFDVRGEFTDSVNVLRLVIWGMPFLSALIILNRLLLAAGRETDFIIIALVAMLSNIGLNLVLIPHFTYYGAAVASVVSLAISGFLHFVYVRRASLQIPLGRALGGSASALLLSWLATAAVVRLLLPSWWTGWFALPVASGWVPFLVVVAIWGLLFVGANFALKVLGREDLAILRRLLNPAA